MKRLWWKIRAYQYMLGAAGWARWGYVGELYDFYATWELSPEDAVREDMSWWGES
jgi:hypothetical protein